MNAAHNGGGGRRMPVDTRSSLITDERPVRLRARPDLRATAVEVAGRRMWNVADPVSLRYYQLRDEEMSILRGLDGRRSMRDLQALVERDCAPRRLRLADLQAYLAQLHREGLVLVDAPGQSDVHLTRRREDSQRRWWSVATNPLAIRLPGISAAPLLNWLYPRCRWMFSRWFIGISVAWCVIAGVWLALRIDAVRSQWPELSTLTSGDNLVLLMLAVAIAKGLHELGHALTCRHLGADCHELGLMLLVFTPSLYCNVSDAWMLPDKWRRMAIAAAGIGVELVLAATCAVFWLLSEPGVAHSLALNMALVCSVGTVVFNANPLLRFDGYYVLSDWWERPNLDERATTAWYAMIGRWCLGQAASPSRDADEPAAGLLVYAITARVYRLVLTAGIVWFLFAHLEPRGLGVFARVLTILVVVGLASGPVTRAWAFFHDPARQRPPPRRRALLAVGLAAGLTILAFWPWPNSVVAPAVVRPRGARDVVAPVRGIVIDALPFGSTVTAGEKVAQLRSDSLELDAARLAGLVNEQRMLVEQLRRIQATDASAGNRLPAAEQALRDLQSLHAKKLEQMKRLAITAPTGGVVYPPRMVATDARSDDATDEALPAFDLSQRGRTLDAGSSLCVIGDPRRWEAVAVLAESEVADVAVGQAVILMPAGGANRQVSGVVVELAELDSRDLPPELLAAGLIDAAPRGPHALAPVYFEARIELESDGQPLVLGATARVKIHVERRSLAQRLVRLLRQSLPFAG